MNESNSWIIEVDAKSFENDAIRRSLDVPVIVDFWAPWCEPCKTLGPLLEKRAIDGDGRFLLAKVDIDKSPELAQALRVQGIPAVFAIVEGQLADGFQGALPEAELDEFLDRVAPPRIDERTLALHGARDAANKGDRAVAIGILREHLETTPNHSEARFLLADLLIDERDAPAARAVYDTLSAEDKSSAEGKALADRLEFAESAVDVDELREAVRAAPDDAAARVALGTALIAAKDYNDGLEELLEAVRLDPEGDGATAREAMLGTFEVLGLEDPIANDFRFKLSLELFA